MLRRFTAPFAVGLLLVLALISSLAVPASAVTTAPGAPTAVSGVADYLKVKVSWTAPTSNGGAPITGYTVTSSPGSFTCTTPTTSCTVTGLTGGTNYTFTVRATNSAGAGAASVASAAVKPLTPTAPGAPTAVTATADYLQAKVSWTAPTSNGGSPVTGYTVTSSPGSFTCTAATTSCTVTGLTGGTNYTFTVKATNAVGSSAASTASASVKVLALTAPAAPTGVTGIADYLAVKVSWTAPTVNGGSPVTGYTVTSSPGSFTCTSVTTSCTVTGLTGGTNYTFTVKATNTTGTSAASTASAAIKPLSPTAPGAPTGVTGVADYLAVKVSWTAPASNGGSPITGYTVTSSPGSFTCTSVTTSCTVTGLTGGTTYTFTVKATNAAGTSAASTASTGVKALTPAAPGAPTGVKASLTTSGGIGATVTWTAPVSAGSSPITGYTVTSAPGGLTCTTSSTTCDVLGLNPKTSYTFTVRATNAVGNGVASAASTALVTPANEPGAPTGVAGTPLALRIMVSWSAPTYAGQPAPEGQASGITGYTVTASPGEGTCTTTGFTQCEITGLNPATTYTFTVKATNYYGSSVASAPSTGVKPLSAVAPDAPTIKSTTVGYEQVTVLYNAPTNDGGSPVTSYTVTSSPGGFTCTKQGGASSGCIVTGLTAGTFYTFTVTATNIAGTSAASAPSVSVQPLSPTVPGAPTNVRGVFTAGSGMSVFFSAPTFNGGSVITGYTVTASPGGATCQATAGFCVITGLAAGSYTFTVTATNKVGTGVASAPSAAVAVQAAPGAPTNISVTFASSPLPGYATATISWSAPASDGGSTILAYSATPSDPSIMPCNVSAAETSCNRSVALGTSFTVSVTAQNQLGVGPAGTSSTVTAAVVPGAPRIGTVTSGDGRVAVMVYANSVDQGFGVTSYTVTSSPGGFTCTITLPVAFGQPTCVVTGLTNGTAYTFTATATSPGGTSPASAPSNSVTPAPAVPVPTGVTIDAGNGQVTVSWTAVTPPAGMTITGYTAAAGFSGTCTTTTATSCTISNLTNNSSYSITVKANSSLGTSSLPSTGVFARPSGDVPRAISGQPTVTQTADGTVVVSWSTFPDPFTYEPKITGYSVTSSDATKTCTSTSALSCTISGLTAGTSYTFTVTRSNLNGASLPSPASTAYTVVSTPGAPTDLKVNYDLSMCVGCVTLYYTMPTNNGGSRILDYQITSSPGGITQTCTEASVNTRCALTGLAGNTSYTFTVRARNAVGYGPASVASPAITSMGLPGAPTNVVATKGNLAASVTWTAPTVTGGQYIQVSSYLVTSSGGQTCTATFTSCVVKGLTAGVNYTFTVTATTRLGTGPASAPSAAIAPLAAVAPSAPTWISYSTPANKSTTLTWGWAANDGGSPVTSYTVTNSSGAVVCTVTSVPVGQSQFSCLASNLATGVNYFYVVATNAVGAGTKSTAWQVNNNT